MQRELAIDNYDMSFLFERMVVEHSYSFLLLSKLESEFKKFLKILLKEDGPIAMIDSRIDDFWHTFILFTPQYAEFCRTTMGFFVHHQPRTSKTPVPISAIGNFVYAYRRHYGELDNFWLETLPKHVAASIKMNVMPTELDNPWSGWTGRTLESMDLL